MELMSQDALFDSLVEMSDRCKVCFKWPSEVGVHGVREKEVYSEHYCLECWNKKMKGRLLND